MNILILFLISQNYMSLLMILLGMFDTLKQNKISYSHLDMLSDHVKFEKYLAFFSKMVNLFNRIKSNRNLIYFSLAIQDEIQSISSVQQITADDVHRQTILFSLDLLCRYLLVLEHLILNNDQQQNLGTSNNKKAKRSIQTCQIDWYINERDEILQLFTNLIKLDLRQFWHETERLEDQEIGK